MTQIIHLNNEIKDISLIISQLDIFHAFSIVASVEGWSCPKLSENEFSIVGGWHPLIKKSVKEAFIPHDLTLNSNTYFGLITGPIWQVRQQ